MKRAVRYIVFVVVIVVVGVVAFNTHKAPTQAVARHDAAHVTLPTVQVAPLTPQHTQLRATAYASTSSQQSLQIIAKVNGIVEAIQFMPGSHVDKGQVLFKIHSSDLTNTLHALRAQMINSKSKYQAESRVKKFYAETDLNDDRLKYTAALNAYNQLQNQLIIKAPISGEISDTQYSVGSNVSIGDNIATIVDKTKLKLSYQLLSRYASSVKVGQSVIFYPEGSNKPYHGRVSYIAPSLDPDSYDVSLQAILTQPGPLQPNVFGRVIQTLNADTALLAVPQNKVLTDALGFYIYSVKHGKIVKLYFNPGAVTAEGMIPIVSGLSPGVLTIVSDTRALTAGEPVKAVTV